jgi:hypothetical protein
MYLGEEWKILKNKFKKKKDVFDFKTLKKIYLFIHSGQNSILIRLHNIQCNVLFLRLLVRN